MPVNPTESQSDASRLNGQQSHGPVTPEGKANSSKNALKSGLYAKTILLAEESKEEYDAHCAQISSSFDCETGYEQVELKSLCNTAWLMIRIQRLHGVALVEGTMKDLNSISQQLSRIRRDKEGIEKNLRGMIREREKEQKIELDDAAVIREADVKEGRDRDLSALGFIFTNQQIDNYIGHQNAIRRSKAIVFGTYNAGRK